MRKVLVLVLALAMILGSFAFTFAATPSDVVGEDCEDAVNVLTELGVIAGYPDGSYKPAGIVTRGEMAKIIICALGLEDYAAGRSSFSDMAGNWSDKYVAYAVSLGIINGYPDGTFKPSNTVSYDEAAKMLVAALGYTEESLVGAWPVNWVTKAKVLGILDDITAGTAGANRGDIAIMTYQTLDQAIGMTNKDGDFTASTPADTMLDRLSAQAYDPDNNAYDQNLVIVAGASTVGASFVVTGDEESVISLKNLQGALVTAYANSDNEIIAIKEVKSTFYTGEFDDNAGGAALVNGTDEFGDYEVKASAIPAAVTGIAGDKLTVAFVNGDVAGGAVDEIATAVVAGGSDYTIACDMSGNYITKIYSIASWTVSGADVIEKADLEDIEEDSKLFGFDFEQDDDDKIDTTTFALFGAASLSDIDVDDVVYVYDDGTYITKVEVGTETASGEVTRIKGTDFTIGGKIYEFAAVAIPGAIGSAAVDIEDELDMKLDYAGNIYDYEKVSGESDLYGIVLRTGVASEDPGDLGASDAEIELFMADGTKKTFTVDYDQFAFTAAGVAVLTPGVPATIYDQNAFLAGASDDAWLLAAGDVVEYALNKDGEVESLEWVADAAPLTAKRADTTLAGAGKLSASGYYQVAEVASDALIMAYNAFTTDEDDYSVIARASLLGSDIPANAFYVVDSGKIVFMYISDAATSESVYGVLVDAEVNSSDAGYGVDLLINGEAVYYDSEVDYTGLAMNRPVKVDFSANGDVSALTPIATLVVAGDVYGTANLDSALTFADTGVIESATVSGSVVELTGSTFEINGTGALHASIDWVTLHSDVTVYEWNATDGVYDAASTSAIRNATDVAFFDTLDDDVAVFNMVLVRADGAAY